MHYYVHNMLYVLLKAVLPVCMKYIAQGESQVANIVQGEAGCYSYLSQDYHQEPYISYKRSTVL